MSKWRRIDWAKMLSKISGISKWFISFNFILAHFWWKWCDHLTLVKVLALAHYDRSSVCCKFDVAEETSFFCWFWNLWNVWIWWKLWIFVIWKSFPKSVSRWAKYTLRLNFQFLKFLVHKWSIWWFVCPFFIFCFLVYFLLKMA